MLTAGTRPKSARRIDRRRRRADARMRGVCECAVCPARADPPSPSRPVCAPLAQLRVVDDRVSTPSPSRFRPSAVGRSLRDQAGAATATRPRAARSSLASRPPPGARVASRRGRLLAQQPVMSTPPGPSSPLRARRGGARSAASGFAARRRARRRRRQLRQGPRQDAQPPPTCPNTPPPRWSSRRRPPARSTAA